MSDCHPGNPISIPVRVRSEDIFFTCHIWRPTLIHPIAPCSNSPSLIRNHSLWPGTSRTEPNLVGENVIGYRYIYTLVQLCCTSRLLWRPDRVSGCHLGDPGSIPSGSGPKIFFFTCHIVTITVVFLLWFSVACFWCQSFCVVSLYVCSYNFSSVSVAEWPRFGEIAAHSVD